MKKILNLEEAKQYANENLYEADLYLFPLDAAVKCGLLIAIDQEHFAITE